MNPMFYLPHPMATSHCIAIGAIVLVIANKLLAMASCILVAV
jgi:hypothetical protein